MNYCTLLIYQENEARPLILELEREFISKDFGSDSKIEEYLLFKLKNICGLTQNDIIGWRISKRNC